MIKSCENEVIELHVFFEDWFNGHIAPTDDQFNRLKSALAPGFRMINPGGKIIERDPLLDRIRKSHHRCKGKENHFNIRIKHLDTQKLGNIHCLVLYEEWQSNGEQTDEKGRLSSALFKQANSAPNNVQWIHLHEVWITDE